MDCVSVSGVIKQFGSVTALAGVDLAVAEGEIVALLGPNGAGKSTLLRILGTTVLADDGTAKVAGHDVVDAPTEVRRAVGIMLGNERSWYWRLTGRHNLEFFGMLHGLARAEARERTRRLLEQVGLENDADRLFAGYSSGMRARLSLARALISEPRVLLLDEPTQNLDPVVAATFRELVGGLARERGVGTLLVTHDLHEAAAVADRIAGLVAGRIAFHRDRGASPDELEAALLAADRR
jgi:ABC-2 type transport system ATP-binding protein